MRGQFEVRRNRPGLLDRSRRPGEGILCDRRRRSSECAAGDDLSGADLELGAVNLNVLGLQVATQPISIDVSGVTGGTNVLGSLICTILETVNNVVGLVNLLNQLLGILGGLTG